MSWTAEHFTRQEMACKCGHCDGRAEMEQEFMDRLDMLRKVLGPLTITSGFRCPNHPSEARKSTPGSHAYGIAADIAVSGGKKRHETIVAALDLGFEGIGVAKTFVHVDLGHPSAGRPAVWTYT